MSKLVDERVVEMRFDNKDFESNVKTSMSTLDKLKAALKLPDTSSKTSLNNLSGSVKTATSNVNGLNTAVNTVKASFSALDVVGATAIANITNGIVNASKNLISSFTIAPIMDGFREYETQMNSVQTILANTASKGTTMSEVTAALDELNTYADQTIYNFAEMTKNIGTFTAAGVDLDKSVAAIKGIANLGAMSGSTSAQVSTAMYQLSQALAAGKVSLQDWNSVVTAGMGGEQFQNALKRTAEHFGTDVDAMIKKYGSFRESLTRGGWLTAEVLTETLNQIGGAYDETALKAQGYSDTQIQEILQMAQTAEEAATKVKTFTQLMSTLSEAAGSGWAKSFQLILGDFEEARTFFTSLSDYLGDIISSSADARNNVLEEAFGSNFSKITKQVEEAGVPLDTFTDKLKEVAKASYNIDLDKMAEQFGSLDLAMQNIPQAGDMVIDTIKALAGAGTSMNDSTAAMTDKLEYFQNVVDEVWKGNFKNAPERYELLAKAGYDYAQVQDLVNKTVDGHKLTLEDLSDTQLKAIGYTDQEVSKLKELAKQAEQSGTSLNELIENINKPSGRQLFLDSILNTVKAIAEPLKAVGQAFGEVFAIDPTNLYSAIEALHDFTSALVIDEGTYNNLVSTFKGLFGIISIFTTFASGGFGIAFKALTAILENFDLGILDVTAAIGEAIYQFSEFITSGEIIKTVFSGVIDILKGLGAPIEDFVSSLSDMPNVQKALNGISEFFDKIYNAFKSFAMIAKNEGPAAAVKELVSEIEDALGGLSWENVLSGLSNFGNMIRDAFSTAVAAAQEIGPDIIAGLQNGLTEGISKAAQIMREIGTKIIEAIKAVLGIHSPSTVMFEIGQNIIQGLINGINSLIDGVFDIISNIGSNIADLLKNVDWGTVLTIGFAVGGFATAWKALNVLESFAAPFEAVGKAFNNVAGVIGSAKGVLDALSGTLKSYQTKIKADAIKSVAVAIAILAGSIVVLCQMDTGKLWNSVGALAVLGGVLAGLAVALNKFTSFGSSGRGGLKDSAKQLLDITKIAGLLVSMGASLLLLAGAMKIIGSMDAGQVKQASLVMAAFGGLMSALVMVSKFGGKAKQIEQIGKLATKLGTAMLLLGVSLRLIGGMDVSQVQQAVAVVGMIGLIFSALIIVSQFAGKSKQIDKIGSMARSLGVAMLLLTASLKIIGGMDTGEVQKALTVIGLIGLMFAALIGLSSYAKVDMSKIGTSLLSMAGAIGILAVAMRLIGGMDVSSIVKASLGIAALGAIVVAMVKFTQVAGGGQMVKAGATLLAMSVAVGILAGVSVLLGMVKTENLVKGIAAVTALSLLMSIMARSARGVGDAKGTMIGMAVVIGVLAASLALLSFLDPNTLMAPLACLTVLMGMFSIMAKSMTGIDGAYKTALAMSLVFTVLAGALYILASLPLERTAGAAASLIAVMLSMSAACKILSGIQSVSGSALAAMGVMLLIVTGIATILGVMSALNVQTSLSNAAALSTMLLSMALACNILGSIQTVSPNALAAMGILTAIVAGLAVILGVMSTLNVQASMTNVLALSALLYAMTGCVAVLSVIPSVSPNALAAIGIISAVVAGLAVILGVMSALNVEASMTNVIALSTLLLAMSGAVAILSLIPSVSPNALMAIGVITAVVAGIAIILGVLSALDIQPSMETALSLSTLLLAMSVATGILGAIGPLAASAVAGAAGLAGVVGVLTAVIAAFGALKQIPGFEWLIGEGGEMLQKVGDAIGKFIGGFVGGALEGVTDSLGGVADNLSDFMVRLTPFLMGAKMIDPSMAEAVSNLAGMILQLTGAGLLEAVTSFVTGGSSLTSFAEQLVPFGQAMMQYSQAVSGIDSGAIQASATAGQALAELANSLPKEGGLAQAIFGESADLGNFGSQLVMFGTAIKAYSVAISGIDTAAIQASATAGQALSELANSLPKEGGLAQAIFGENTDLASFGNQLVLFALGLKNYATNVAGLDTAAIQNSIPAAQALTELAQSVSQIKENGFFDIFSGGNTNLSTFGTQLASFGGALKGYADKVTGLDFASITSANNAVGVIVNMIKNNAEADFDGGIANLEKIEDVGSAIKKYSESISGVETGQISSTASAITSIISSVNQMVNINLDGIASFKKAIDELASVNIQGVVDAFANASGEMLAAGANLMSWLSQGISSGANMPVSAAQQVMVSLASMIGQAALVFSTGGLAIAQNLAKGITQGAPLVRVAAMAAVTNAAGGIRAAYSSFYSAGRYLCSGMAAGITAGSYAVRARAAAMASAAATAARSALQINSPSKVFRKIGKGVPEGFAQGISLMGTSVKESAKTMSVDAIETTRRVIDKMGSLIDSDFDVNPVISPVIDLDNVQNGVASINGMLGNMEPITLMANVGSINRMMSQRNQNGEYGEVVSAINKLDESLSALERPSYNVGGITYDDGSVVAGAVNQLIRATRIERRM